MENAESLASAENAGIFKACCDETRLRVLELLRGGECCACELLDDVGVGQSTLSHHMKILVESGIVSARKDGKWTHYSIDRNGSAAAVRLLKKITTVSGVRDGNGNKGCCQ
ncbi:MAG: metalloregulator ArsR/SmtB family transcription factor [Treponema sp.]|nr:metalloregulator ArsR/SmtB family transcription factor [Treponema sp.]